MSDPSLKVLLIGDQPQCLELLRKQRFEVACAGTLANGLVQLKTGHIDLAFMALSLPDGQGTEVFNKIHDAAPHVPIIALAIQSEEEVAAGLILLGAQDYLFVSELTGPLLARAIRNAVKRHLARTEARTKAEEKLAERTEEVFHRNLELASTNTILQQQIAERERIEQALGRERLLMRTLIDNLPDAIYAKDTEGRKTLANPADLKNLQCKTEAETIGKTDFDFFPKDIAEKFWSDDKKVISGEAVINREEFFFGEEGRKHWLLTSKLPLRDQNGKIIGLVGIGRDITARKQAEEKLAYEKELFQTLLQTVPDNIYFKDRKSCFVRVSRSKVEDTLHVVRDTHRAAHPNDSPDKWPAHIAGVEPFAEWLIGKSDFDTYPKTYARVAYEDEQEIMRTGKPIVGKLQKTTLSNGKSGWWLSTKMPWRDKDGNIIGTFGISKDVTALEEAKELLVHERLLLRTLVDNLPDAIYAKDTACRKTLANAADVKNLHCKTEAETIGKTDFDLFPPKLAERLYADDQKVINGEAVVNREEFFKDEEGRERWLLTSKLPLRDSGGKIIGLVGINRDITAHKQAEEKLAYEQELFQMLLQTVPDNIYFKDRKSCFVRMSWSKAGDTLQTARDNYRTAHPNAGPYEWPSYMVSVESFAKWLIGRSDFDTYPEAHARAVYEDEQEIIRTGKPIIGKLQKATLSNGKSIWWLSTKMPWYDRGGNIIGTFGISKDVTALEEAEDALARERLLMRTLIDNLPDAIYAKDLEGRKTLANPADLKNLKCKSEAETIGKTDFDFFPKEVAEKFWADDQRVINSGPVINREEFFFGEDGQKRWLLTSKLPLRDQNGKVTGLIGIGRDITNWKQIEAKLAYERGLFRTLMEYIPDAIYFKDTQSHYVRVGRAKIENNLRLVRERYRSDHPGEPEKKWPAHLQNAEQFESYIAGKTDFDVFTEERARPAFEDEQKILKTGEPIINKLESTRTADGKMAYVLSTKLPWRDDDGKIIGTLGVSRDVTALMQTEEKLAHERLLLRTLIDNLPDAIYAKDTACRKTLANAADLKNLNCKTEAETIGKTDFDLFPRKQAERLYADDQKVINGEAVVNREEFFKDEKGLERWLLTSKLPLRNHDGKIIGLVGINRDITKRKQAEEKLARERLLLRTLIDNLPDAIYAKDLEGRKTLANPADLRNLKCKSEAETIGKTDFDFFPKEVAEKFWADDQKVFNGEPVINREEFFFGEEGRKHWLLTSKLPVLDQKGKITGLIGIGRDVTKRKEVEQALAEHTRQLEEKDQQTAMELSMARELQMAMLPHEFPSVPRHKPPGERDLEFFSFFLPSGVVSGDFFDVVQLSDTTVGLFICDVMGHDVRAALVTAMMRALVVDLSATITDPGELLAQINREVTSVFKQSGSIMYATAFYLVADVARGELRYASAAHPEPIHLRRRRGTAEWLGAESGVKKGPALGLFKDGQFPTHKRPMEVGDLVALFTDGLIEAEGADQESFSPERLLAAVQQRSKLPPKELFNELFDEIKKFSGSSEFDDDVCMVGMEVKRLETGKSGGKT